MTTTTAAPLAEPKTERYARQTRNATVFLAWVVGIMVAAQIALAVIIGVGLAHLASSGSGGTNAPSWGTSCDITNPNWPNC